VPNTSAEAAPPVAAPADDWQKWVAQYNGDEAAAKKAVWETNNRAATAAREKEQIAREKDEIAAKLAAYEQAGIKPTPEAPKPAPQAVPIELKRYDEKIRAVETTFATTQQERAKYSTYGAQLDQEIRNLNRQIANPALSLDRDELVLKLSEKINEREATTQWVAKLDQDLHSFDEKWQELKENRDIRAAILEQRKELEAAREAKARSDEERETSQYVEGFQRDWNSTIEKVSKDAAVIPSVLSTGFEKYVRTLGKAYVADGTPIEDVGKFVADAAKDYMADKEAFHQVKSAEYAKQKKADERNESPTGKDAVASPTKRSNDFSNWTEKQLREYEESIQL
jgi:hypothetical protein